MGLDATVYCNCYEASNLRTQPPDPTAVSIGADGGLYREGGDLNDDLAFDQWLRDRACEHGDGVLLHHRIGNIVLVGLLREELASEAASFPVLLEKVLYSGTHAGDYLDTEDVYRLKLELPRLAEFRCRDAADQHYMDNFRQQIAELAEAALSVKKPIAF